MVERVDREMVAWLGEICNWEDYEGACLKDASDIPTRVLSPRSALH